MKSYLLKSWATTKDLDLTQIYDAGIPRIFLVVMHSSGISLLA